MGKWGVPQDHEYWGNYHKIMIGEISKQWDCFFKKQLKSDHIYDTDSGKGHSDTRGCYNDL